MEKAQLSDEAKGSKCIICCCSLSNKPENKKRAGLSSSSSVKSGDLLRQFCERFLSLEKPAPWRDLSVCLDCSDNVKVALDTGFKMELVEGRVRKLQLELLRELNELKIYVDLLAWQLGKIERCVKETESDYKRTSSSSSGATGKRGRGRPPRVKVQDECLVVRKGLANVTGDLQLFQNDLKNKVSCDTKTIRFTPKHINDITSTRADDHFNGTYLRTLPPPQQLGHHGRGRRDQDNRVESEMSGSEYCPSPSSCDPPSPPCSYQGDDNEEMSSDFIPTTPSKQTTLLIKKIKSEPLSDFEDNDANEDNEMTTEDAKSTAATEQDITSTSTSTKRAKKTDFATWTPVPLSEADIKDHFRKLFIQKSKSKKCKHLHQRTYYCAYGLKKQSCPVRLLVREFANGTRQILQNTFDHDQHRKGAYGLTKEQKWFVRDSIKKGFNRPLDIILRFQHEGRKAPLRSKLSTFLERERKQIPKGKEGCQIEDEQMMPKEGDADDASGIKSEPTNVDDEALVLCETSGQLKIKEGDDDVESSPEEGDLVLCPKSGQLKRKGMNEFHNHWKAMPSSTSDEKIKEEFRIFQNKHGKRYSRTVYYCAHGGRKMSCPVRLQVLVYKNNGMRLVFKNKLEHRNHRQGTYGLTKEQRQFVEECLGRGVKKPSLILNCLREEGIEVSDERKVRSFVDRWRKAQKLKLAAEVEGHHHMKNESIDMEEEGQPSHGSSRVPEEAQKPSQNEDPLYFT